MNQKELMLFADAIESALKPLVEATKNDTAATAALCREQRETNELLKRLVGTNNTFISTLTSFLREDHKDRLQRELREAEQAKLREPLPADLMY